MIRASVAGCVVSASARGARVREVLEAAFGRAFVERAVEAEDEPRARGNVVVVRGLGGGDRALQRLLTDGVVAAEALRGAEHVERLGLQRRPRVLRRFDKRR